MRNNGRETPDISALVEGKTTPDVVPFFSGGEWRCSDDGLSFATYDPATGAKICEVAEANADDLGHAIEAARSAAADWASEPVAARAEAIAELGRRLLLRAAEFGIIDAIDNGSPVKAMTADAQKGGNSLIYTAGLAHELKGRTYPVSRGSLHYTTLEPWGVVARITAFNHPVLFTCARLAPALVAGNAVILKPSELAPLGPLAFASLAADVLPQGVLSILTGGAALGRAIAQSPDIRRLSFTGSVDTGLAVSAEAAASGVVKAVTLELGGKNPIIVFPDADLEQAARAVVRGMNFTRVQGQSCGSTSRLLVHSSVHREVVDRVVELASAIRVGMPRQPETEMGSLINRVSQDRCRSYTASALRTGARLLLGGSPPGDPELARGAFFMPTILEAVHPQAEVAREEVFGPVLTVSAWTDEDTALAEANALPYGLTASVWTADLNAAMRATKALQCGYIWVNDVETRYLSVPFGGWKDSGEGLEQGLEEILSFTRTKAVNLTFVGAQA